MKYYPHDLNETIDGTRWISDDRVSACLDRASGWMTQIDFHGLQPVSRNAKQLAHTDGVFQFYIEDEKQTVSLAAVAADLEWAPAGFRLKGEANWGRWQLDLRVIQDMLVSECAVTLRQPQKNGLKFIVRFNPDSLTREVHGERSWMRLDEHPTDFLFFQATDQIELAEWLRREGDYQGDFLIPEGLRRIIFKKPVVSGLGRWENVHAEYQTSTLKIYDADTFVGIGGKDFVTESKADDWYCFTTELIHEDANVWKSPPFVAAFSITAISAVVLHERIEKIPQKNKQHDLRYERLQSNLPRLMWPHHPALADFFEKAPQIIESAKVNSNGMTRACPGTYYWIWAWDNMVTATAMARWGDTDGMRRIVDFIRIHRDVDGAIPGRWTRDLQPMDSRGIGAMDFLFSQLVLNLYGEIRDRQVIRANYPVLVDAFRLLSDRIDSNGFYQTLGMYPDLPGKMGRTECSYVAIDAGAWYCFLRNIEKMARLLDDDRTASQAVDLSRQVVDNFQKLFWDDEKGFIVDSVNSVTGMRVKSYPLFSLLFMESPFGHYLLGRKKSACARFIRQHLLSEQGVRQTPVWDLNHTSEPVMSAWYPHWDLPAMKVMADADHAEAIEQWLDLVADSYSSLGYCPEFMDTEAADAEKWSRHGAAWNLNCTAGWYQSIIYALTGLDFDMGGITCHSVGKLPESEIEQVVYRDSVWSVRRIGVGRFIKRILVDDIVVEHTLKIPVAFYTAGAHELVIEQSDIAPSVPQLAAVWGGEVRAVSARDGELEADIFGLGLTDVVIFATQSLTIELDGQVISETVAISDTEVMIQLLLSGQHKLKIKNKRLECS